MKKESPPIKQKDKKKHDFVDPASGLSADMVKKRMADGQQNKHCAVPSKTAGSIIKDNLCTLFNLINLLLALAVIAVGSYKNVLFMGVVLCNLAIGIFQELRAKQAVDKLSLLASVKAHVIRDGQQTEIPIDQVVLDDILALKSGSQLVTDCILQVGECDVN
ncbi:MAG: cation-translocating P-type ATPase, partial [Oscillospiraceae bacterium]